MEWPFPNNHKPSEPEAKPVETLVVVVPEIKPKYVQKRFDLDTYFFEITTNDIEYEYYGSYSGKKYKVRMLNHLTKKVMGDMVYELKHSPEEFLDFDGVVLKREDIKSAKYGREYEDKMVLEDDDTTEVEYKEINKTDICHLIV